MLRSALKLLLFATGLCLSLAACTQATPPLPTPTPTPIPFHAPPGWRLAWQDEFDGSAGTKPDPKKWDYDLGGGGWGNKELQYYTYQQAENAALDGQGKLVITAVRLAEPGAGKLNCWYGPCEYTSARLLTKGRFDFTYGRVEARIKIPYGQGIWPAFWMLGADIDRVGWPKCGEIDIMENIGREPDTIHGTVHGPGYSGSRGIGKPSYLFTAKFSDEFHVYAIEWEAQDIRWYFDDKPFFSLSPDQVPGDWVFNHPFFLILNLAVGGNWPGSPDETTVFPQTLTVDYVRVFQR